jgi:membrane protein DedA with SNARE-associated domain
MQAWIDSLLALGESIRHGNIPDLGVWTYVVLGLLVATEGPLSTLIGAAAAAAGALDVRLVFLVTVVGNVVGDSLWYSIGYHGKIDHLLRRGRWLGIKREHFERLEREMHAHAAKVIVLSKLAYGLIIPTLVAAGAARVPLRRWFPVVFVVETLWSLLLVWVGYHATGLIADIESGLRNIGLLVLAALVVAALWLVRRRIDRAELEMDPLLHDDEPLFAAAGEPGLAPAAHGADDLVQHGAESRAVVSSNEETEVEAERVLR